MSTRPNLDYTIYSRDFVTGQIIRFGTFETYSDSWGNAATAIAIPYQTSLTSGELAELTKRARKLISTYLVRTEAISSGYRLKLAYQIDFASHEGHAAIVLRFSEA